jgi:hypothetical protein
VVPTPSQKSHTQHSIPVFTNEDYLAELLVESGIITAEQLKRLDIEGILLPQLNIAYDSGQVPD